MSFEVGGEGAPAGVGQSGAVLWHEGLDGGDGRLLVAQLLDTCPRRRELLHDVLMHAGHQRGRGVRASR